MQDVKYMPDDWFFFGFEVDGLLLAALEECHCGPYAGGIVRLPMNDTFCPLGPIRTIF